MSTRRTPACRGSTNASVEQTLLKSQALLHLLGREAVDRLENGSPRCPHLAAGIDLLIQDTTQEIEEALHPV